MVKILLYYYFLTLLSKIVLGIDEIYINDDDEHKLPFTGNSELTILLDYGYKLKVNVENAQIDGAKKDRLIIQPVSDDSKGIMVTQTVNNKEFVAFSNQVKLQFFDSGNSLANLIVQRIGEAILSTTTEPPTTTRWPIPGKEEPSNLTVHISGKSYLEYRNQTLYRNLQESISKMATVHCEKTNLELAENITWENVIISLLARCPFNWPNSEDCVELTFAVPVILVDPKEYELRKSYLQDMWSRYASEYLNVSSLGVYEVPQTDKTVKIWLILGCSIVISFLLLLMLPLVGKKFMWLRERYRATPPERNKIKEDRDSLGPHEFQHIPEMFETDITETTNQHKNEMGDSSSEDEVYINKRKKPAVTHCQINSYDNQAYSEI